MFTRLYLCLPVYLCYLSLPLLTGAHLFLPLFIHARYHVYHCSLVFNYVYHFLFVPI